MRTNDRTRVNGPEGGERSDSTPSRRQFLGSILVAGGAPSSQSTRGRTGETGRAWAQAGEDETVETAFELDGTLEGWLGRAPEAIDGETNPTLRLQPGGRYRLTWHNADGVEHNFAILDDEGNQITSTEFTSEEGATRSLTFTATEQMAQYYCAVHTDRMRGEVVVGEETPIAGTPTERDVDVETIFELGGVISGWQGRLPEERDADQRIDGEINPTLELEAGTRYMVIWENADGVPHDFTIRDADGNDLLATETTGVEGERLSLTFTASPEMAQYVCTYHPETMVGELQVGGGGLGSPFTGPGGIAGGLAVVVIGLVATFSYVLSRYFDDTHEP